jgi:hypothetical protein
MAEDLTAHTVLAAVAVVHNEVRTEPRIPGRAVNTVGHPRFSEVTRLTSCSEENLNCCEAGTRVCDTECAAVPLMRCMSPGDCDHTVA